MANKSCCICLERCRDRVCSRCQAVAHPACWKQYTVQGEGSLNCPACRGTQVMGIVKTRKQTRLNRLEEFSESLEAAGCGLGDKTAPTWKESVDEFFRVLLEHVALLKTLEEKEGLGSCLKNLHKHGIGRAAEVYKRIFGQEAMFD